MKKWFITEVGAYRDESGNGTDQVTLQRKISSSSFMSLFGKTVEGPVRSERTVDNHAPAISLFSRAHISAS